MDSDGSNAIDKEEAIKHFTMKKSFAKVSALEFFNIVDVNHDG